MGKNQWLLVAATIIVIVVAFAYVFLNHWGGFGGASGPGRSGYSL